MSSFDSTPKNDKGYPSIGGLQTTSQGGFGYFPQTDLFGDMGSDQEGPLTQSEDRHEFGDAFVNDANQKLMLGDDAILSLQPAGSGFTQNQQQPQQHSQTPNPIQHSTPVQHHQQHQAQLQQPQQQNHHHKQTLNDLISVASQHQ